MNDIKHLAGVCIAFVLCAFVCVASAWHVGEGKFIQAEGAVVPSVNPPEEKWDRTFSGADRAYGNSVQQTSEYILLASTRFYSAGYYNDA